MKTNDIKRGMRVRLRWSGWEGTMSDNAKGNTRIVLVEGMYTELGSVYAHDIVAVQVEDKWVKVEHTDSQKRLMSKVKVLMGF
jgi:hypothetical protein